MPHTPRAAAAPAPAGPGTGGNPVGARKQALRARVRTGRRARTPQQRRADAERVAALLLALPEVTSARCVAAYTSTPVEPGTGRSLFSREFWCRYVQERYFLSFAGS